MKVIYTLSLLLFLSQSCTKYTETTIEAQLMSKSWQVYDVYMQDSIMHNISLVGPCNFDNTFYFKTVDAVLLDRGKDKCDSNEEQLVNGFWAVSPDRQHIDLLGITYYISQINSQKLVLRLDDYAFPWGDTAKHLFFCFIPL